ncbi:MAG TPA: hypothetical protein VFH45_01110 [Acidimicrobiales bacterium]|nr:hypothetical protein [Acidimicrobiales bacterium]
MTAGAAAGSPLVHRVVARNAATDSDNRIHSDEEARRRGFRGGLVPGVTVYGYMTTPLVGLLGRSWLATGTLAARFVSPVYDGEEAVVTVEELQPGAAPAPVVVSPPSTPEPTATPAADRPGRHFAVTVTDPEGRTCAVGHASLPDRAVPAPDPGRFPRREPPSERPPADERSLAPGTVLGTVAAGVHAERAGPYLEVLADGLPVYRDEGLAHPGFLILSANTALAANVVLGPWIHTSSEVTNFEAVPDGARLETRAVVADRFEHKGHHFVVLDVARVSGDRVVMYARHSAIYRLRP